MAAFPANPERSFSGTFTFVEIDGAWRSYAANPPAGQAAPPDPDEPAFGNFKNRAANQEAIQQAKQWEHEAFVAPNADLETDGSVLARSGERPSTSAGERGCESVIITDYAARVRIVRGDVECDEARQVVRSAILGEQTGEWTCAGEQRKTCTKSDATIWGEPG